jgi:hypothetical protein
VTASALHSAEREFSHRVWTEVLERRVDERGRVDYAGLARDRAGLDRYLAALARVSPDSHPWLFADRDHELAYWLNAYNAQVFRGVLERWPGLESVWREGLFGLGFFRQRSVVLGGESTSLMTLENQIVRERYADPRIHAAFNCASISCPRLPRKAFEGSTLDDELDAAMREFVSDERNVRFDAESRRLLLSRIFDWFDDDFSTTSAGGATPTPVSPTTSIASAHRAIRCRATCACASSATTSGSTRKLRSRRAEDSLTAARSEP